MNSTQPGNRWRRLLIGLSFLTYGCSFETVLERKDVEFFKIEEVRSADGFSLNVSGLAFRSYMAVSHIEAHRESSTMTVLVYLVLAKQGLSGSFVYELPVPSSVDEVRFGKENVVVWKRADGPSH